MVPAESATMDDSGKRLGVLLTRGTLANETHVAQFEQRDLSPIHR
jgi:hypothetical protein